MGQSLMMGAISPSFSFEFDVSGKRKKRAALVLTGVIVHRADPHNYERKVLFIGQKRTDKQLPRW